jgi:hypothetical protein
MPSFASDDLDTSLLNGRCVFDYQNSVFRAATTSIIRSSKTKGEALSRLELLSELEEVAHASLSKAECTCGHFTGTPNA